MTEPEHAQRIQITFDGHSISAVPGQSAGAALTAAGISSWRSTRKHGRARGLFCGIGVCFDCLITADGKPNQRACLLPVHDGMRLESGLTQRERLDDV